MRPGNGSLNNGSNGAPGQSGVARWMQAVQRVARNPTPMRRLSAVFLAGVSCACAVPDPHIERLALAEPALLAVDVREGEVVVPPREPLPLPSGQPIPHRGERWVHDTDGRVTGFRVGPEADQVQPVERRVGGRWTDVARLGEPGAVRVLADGVALEVLRVGRKTLPDDIARTGGWEFDAALVHRLYIELAAAPPAGATVRVELPGLPPFTAALDTRTARTEGLRVQQVGFRPDDPDKSALFTLWRGDLGPSAFVPGPFEVIDLETGRVAWEGEARLHHDGSQPDTANGIHGALAPVHVLDFTPLERPGRYRIHLPGVGCSHEFVIADAAWARAFAIAAKGFYFQRNGIAHDLRFGPHEAPRAFHPDDGVRVYASRTSLLDSGNGLNALGTDRDNFGNLVAGRTDEAVPDAWGGYKDAGDWDSRIQHLEATRQLLELAAWFPRAVEDVALGLPESDGRIPDLLHEARWNVDHYRRLQTAEGGVRGGVEQEEHPNFGETSWLNSLVNLTYAPDPWSSWLYAATAAQLAHVLRPYDAAAADAYLASALRAHRWAHAERARLARPSLPHAVRDAQNLAAGRLYRETHDAALLEEFRATAVWPAGAHPEAWGESRQGEAVMLAAEGALGEELAAPARAWIVRLAEETARQVETTSLRFAFPSPHVWWGYGAQVNPRGLQYLVWAHRLTGDERHLVALLRGAGFATGLNPTGTVFTSGVGAQPARRPFMIDPRYSGQDFPPGITVYGPLAYKLEGDGAWFRVARPFLHPDPAAWPAAETWYDGFWTIMMNEFTINQSLGPTAHTWGYLAFREPLRPRGAP